ncbi:hypothetical protein EXT70_09885 [Dickeya dadantii]|nr:hypothetical protein [Dickeya dadantii]
MRDILSLTGGQPLAGQIRSQRICHSVAALLQIELLWVCPFDNGKVTPCWPSWKTEVVEDIFLFF